MSREVFRLLRLLHPKDRPFPSTHPSGGSAGHPRPRPKLGHTLSIALPVALLLALVAHIATPAASQVRTKTLQVAQVQAHKMGAVTRAQLLQQINKTVKIEGFFYNGSIPMVIDDIERVKVDMMLPEDSYVPIVGPLPAGLRSGERISIEGTILRPTNQDPTTVRRESLVIKVSAAQKVTILKLPGVRAIAPERIVRPRDIRLAGKITVFPRKVKYAVLIAGGGNAASNHVRYWNDLVTMYNILRAHGYSAANITVLYADGTGRDDSMPVNHSATRANIASVFSDLGSRMTSSDTLYIMLNDHGGGLLTTATGSYQAGFYGGYIDRNNDEVGESYSEPTYDIDANGDGDKNDTFRVDESLSLWNDNISDDAFASEVNKIRNYETMIIQMKQCFSGGFIADLTAPNRIIMSSSGPEQLSWAHSSLNYGEFTYWYFAALTGNRPDGGGAVNADANGDGKISILEAYNFARASDTRTETPFYEDNGTTPARSGAIPAGGEGAFGAKTFL
jgi:hypothetical protein